MRRFADWVIGRDHALTGVLPACPWSGQQFFAPAVSETAVHVLVSDAGEGVCVRHPL